MNRRCGAARSGALLLAAPGLLALGALGAPARGQATQDVVFETDAKTIGPGRSMYVVGDLPELGANDVSKAVKLGRTADGWRATIRLPAGRSYTYRYYDRSHGEGLVGEALNGKAVGPERQGRTDAAKGVPAHKRIVVHTGLAAPKLHWRQGDSEFASVSMTRAGRGRAKDERRWEVPSFGEARRDVEFFVTDGKETVRDPADGTYVTPLDALLLQDGALYTYTPAAAVSPQRRDYDPKKPPFVASKILNENRPYLVMLPRGYDEHEDRRYPVLYANDGWYWFDEGEYSVDENGRGLAELTRLGKAGEMIVVGVDHADRTVPEKFWQNRFRDFTPPGDFGNSNFGIVEGKADRYAEFLKTELKPLIDARYRTRPDREHTWTVGFSAGGVVALYLGWDHHATFGRTGSFSGAFEAPKFVGRVLKEPKRPIRIYLDAGTVNDYYPLAIGLYDNLVGRVGRQGEPWVVEGDLRFRYGLGHQHNTRDVAKRFTGFLTFLYPGTEEPAGEFEPPPQAAPELGPAEAARLISRAVQKQDVAAAVEALREHGLIDDHNVVRAVARGLDHQAVQVRWAALIVLRYQPNDTALPVLLKAKNNARLQQNPSTAAEYFRALGQRGDPAALPVLQKGLGSTRAEAPAVTRARVEAIGHIRSGDSVKALVQWLAGSDAPAKDSEPAQAACLVLSVLTGHGAGNDPDAWVQWWKGARAGFELPEKPELPPAVDAAWQRLWAAPAGDDLFGRIGPIPGGERGGEPPR